MNMFLTAIIQVAAPAFVEATISAIFTITEAISATLLLYTAPWWQLP
jgi:hypothetical protein